MKTCCFAYPGTYGHECGAPATVYAVKKADNTRSGLYYGGRCEAHAKAKGPDNVGVLRLEPISSQVNEWC